ncbi:MAG: anti-sigma factor [Phenylobacterium sp.]|nr:anti-sigma factor [Phenylobacterium sp.]
MNACPDKAHLVHALADGELDAVNAQAFEAHLKTCPDCAAALGELQALRERIAAPQLRTPAPAALHDRIEGMIAAETERPRRRIPSALPWSLAGGFAALAASLVAMTSLPSTTGLADQLVADHVRSTLAAHLVDVETSDRHTVKPWFNGRIDFAPPVVDLAAQGFPLVGGRVDYLEGRVVAALVYRRGKHVINVFVRPEPKGLRLPVGRAHDGYSLVRWTEGGLEFWAVSDVEPRDLDALKQDFIAATHG